MNRHTLLNCVFLLTVCFSSRAQSAQSIITQLSAINQTVVNKTGNTTAISNRAMNVFLADKTGYLSESSDLSLYTNYVTLNTIEGTLTINHNFQKATGTDEPIKKLFSAGVSINVANEIAAPFLDKKGEKGLGLILGYKWLGKVKTHFATEAPTGNSSTQKQAMDALRAALLQSLKSEIIAKETAFKNAINSVDRTDIPGQNMDTAKAIMLRRFYEDLEDEYAGKFAIQQAALLTKTRNFKQISTCWTSLSSYIPVVSPAYTVAPSLTAAFQKKQAYPLEIMLRHTRLWESTKTGRWFLTLSSKAVLANSKTGFLLNRVDYNEYKTLGGRDTLHFPDITNGQAYVGHYQTFVSPSIRLRFDYFPPADSHIGISVSIEQNIGKYQALNMKIGIPVILINSARTPAANFEFYIQFFDVNNKLKMAEKNGSKTFIGLHVGIPFSRLMY